MACGRRQSLRVAVLATALTSLSPGHQAGPGPVFFGPFRQLRRDDRDARANLESLLAPPPEPAAQSRAPPAVTVAPQKHSRLLAEVPRQLLALPQDTYLGPGYDLTTAVVPRRGGKAVALNLMLDSGLTRSMLAPHVVTFLGLDADDERSYVAANGALTSKTVKLDNVQLDGSGIALGSFTPLIAEFQQSRIGLSLGMQVDGMLGMEFYERFGVQVGDGKLQLFEADAVSEVASDNGLTQLSVVSLNAQLLGIGVESHPGPSGLQAGVLGILDTGAAHTVLNWAAAELLFGATEADIQEMSEKGGSIEASDVSGRPIKMPLATVPLELRGAGQDPRGRVELEPVEVAIGNIALFEKLTGDPKSPVALVGQDILTQRPMLLGARQRLLCFGK